jgi:hypothetical protein
VTEFDTGVSGCAVTRLHDVDRDCTELHPERLSKETNVQHVKIRAVASIDPADQTPFANTSCNKAQSTSTLVKDDEGPKPNSYPARWLRRRHPLSPAAAKVIAGELGYSEVA